MGRVRWWLGEVGRYFGKGDISKYTNLVTMFNYDNYALVIADGKGYVINIIDKTMAYKTANHYLQGTSPIPNWDLIVACDNTNLEIYNSKKLVWESDRIALDRVKLTKASIDKVFGYIWEPDGWYSFTFDIDKRTIVE